MTSAQFSDTLLCLQDNMRSFALSLTADYDEAQDLMQDTTLRVLKNKDKFVDDVNFKGWVLTVMRNIFINNYHKTARVQSHIDHNADTYNLPIQSSGTPDGAINVKEIHSSIDNLNDLLRKPFKMYIDGYKYNEIADQLNIPLGTVKSRIFLARKELQKVLRS